MLNYDELIILDAEDLSEGNIRALYEGSIAPVLRSHGITPAEISEELNPDAASYTVTALGKTYSIFSPEMDVEEGQHWGNATFALFDIVNRQLEKSAYRLYAINAANDLGGMFLTREMREEAVRSMKRKSDWPYLPEPTHPCYGQPQD